MFMCAGASCCSGLLHTWICLHMSELLLGRSGLDELLLGVTPHSGLCVPGRVVARGYSTLGYVWT